MSEAEEFNKVRRILFSTFHKGEEGQEKAFQYLDNYRKKLSRSSYIGLKAELNFYKKYRKEFSLIVAADVGDHTDFSGLLGGKPFRLDVTTNADYKQLKDYEPLQRDDEKYKIAIVTLEGEIEDLVDINFPFCPECEEGRLIDTAILLPENYNDKGDCLWSNDQVLIGVCNVCHYFEEYDRISTGGLFDFNTELGNAYDLYEAKFGNLPRSDEAPIFDEHKIVLQHSQHIIPYLNKEFDKTLMALGGTAYTVTDLRTCDGYHCTKIHWRKDLKLLDEYVLDEYEIDLFHD
ncbi:MAG TPA: hypothetical protein DCE56_20915 [Cyanobacteria bacterium UBA8553]|nr:hypothetical protein [Cyanobacteria bacterium UBA8553]HAJ59164.1 hypothetical protein [Cyanobacteria bacterium UBA8543]